MLLLFGGGLCLVCMLICIEGRISLGIVSVVLCVVCICMNVVLLMLLCMCRLLCFLVVMVVL